MTTSLRLWPGRIEVLLTFPLGILLTTSSFSKAASQPYRPEPSKTIDLFEGFDDSPPVLGPSVKFLADKTGLTMKGLYRGYFYGNLGGGKHQGAAWDQEVRLDAIYDFGFLTETLKGLTFHTEVRDREGQNPNGLIGATASASAFQPSNIESGKYLRLRYFYLEYVTPELFGIKDFFTLSGGWQDPYDFFLQQPLSKLFVNNMFEAAKGLGANIPWTSSYSAWGGYLKIKPRDWLYAQAGLYMAIPNDTVSSNHGLDFQGSRSQPNGLYALAEVGFTPNLGPAELPGKYAIGSYWFGVHNTSWNGTQEPGQYGFYWQADQQLYRAPTNISDKASEASAEPPPQSQLSEKGLYFFSLFTYAPPFNNTISYYFHVGLVYEGLIPSRDQDQLGVIYGEGFYSNELAEQRHSDHLPEPTHQSVLEIDYNIAVTHWLNFKPFYQFFINPASNNSLKNANVLGFEVFATF